MIKLSPNEIQEATEVVKLINDGIKSIDNIEIDSRKIKKGDLFLALKGENLDGHDYIADALSKGAVGYIGESSNVEADFIVEVRDSLAALQDIAKYILKTVKPIVVAITGSTGKTSVKDMLASILENNYKTVATKGNFNNEIGLPLSVLQLECDTRILILEMGTRGLGQISALCKIARPDKALITNIGQAHLELFNNNESLIEAKAEIIKEMNDEGVIFLNIDDEATKSLQKYVGDKKVVTFGKKADISCQIISNDDFAKSLFQLSYGNNKEQIRLNLIGNHFVINACAASAVAIELGVEVRDIKKGLEKLVASPNRMEIIRANDYIILNDTYNSSPDSAIAALQALRNIKSGRKVAILGSMLELGENSITKHRQVGKEVVDNKVDLLFTVGDIGQNIASGAIKSGMDEKNIFSFDDNLNLIKEIDSHLKPQDVILIKASRALKLEIVAKYLQKMR